ncbi:FGGY-family carbohydrate kinase [Schaalia sp. ZJ1691]|uniref:FGGY-family carbohydrate kinase n=1 Tax=Schaalia sp. ZJ1691 TaxID=2709404 RepID=UPI0013EB409F|nr:FGGY-family carbohydrate kinase [Schaalia sp. ZJ1691]
MTEYLVGIDNGSQSTKVTIVDADGTVYATGKCPLRPNSTPRPGVVEHPDDDLWESIGAACREAMSRFDGDPRDIRGIGLCTIRFCRAMLRQDGTLASPVLSWMDSRVSRPYEDDDPDVAWVTTSSGYISVRMTGNFVDTAANYAGMWPLDIHTWQWLPEGEEFDSYGYPREKLFALVNPGDELGRVTAEASRHTGLPEGIPVYATSNDKAVEALGCGIRTEGDLLVSLGTYIAGMAVGTHVAEDATDFWTNYGSEPGVYLYESNGIRRGMWTVSWIADLLRTMAREDEPLDAVVRRLDTLAAEVPAGSDGLMVLLDWLAPTDHPYRKGAFLGFDGRQSGTHMYRAVLEAIALTMRLRVLEMEQELGTSFQQVVLSGGGSNSDLFMQIFADVWGIPAVRMEMNNAAGLGSVICAGVGSGVYSDFAHASRRLVKKGTEFVPNQQNTEVYRRMLALYERLHESLDPVFRQSAEIFG